MVNFAAGINISSSQNLTLKNRQSNRLIPLTTGCRYTKAVGVRDKNIRAALKEEAEDTN